MTGTIELREADFGILTKNLRAHLPAGVRVWVFGSRTRGKARQYSDVDLAIEADQPLDADVVLGLKDALLESDMTVRVDVIDLGTADPAFRRIIESDMIQLPL